MKKILYKTALVIIPICCFISLFLACGNRQDISGTIIAKSGEIQSKYKSTKVYTEYIFAIHPNNKRLSDFDLKVPLHCYVKFNVGDKIILRNEKINEYLKNPKWYELDIIWSVIFAILFTFIIIAIGAYRLNIYLNKIEEREL